MTTIQPDIDRELKRIQGVSGRGLLQIDCEDGRVEADLLAVDVIGCSFQTLGFSTAKLADASLDELKTISEALISRLTYLLEPIGVVEADAQRPDRPAEHQPDDARHDERAGAGRADPTLRLLGFSVLVVEVGAEVGAGHVGRAGEPVS